MALQHLLLSSIKESDLQRLLDDGLGESKVIEYKKELVIFSDEQKREFLSDVTALANTDGGDIVYGIREESGVPVELVGLRHFEADDTIGKIENLLRDAVQPRLAGHQIQLIPLASGNHALIVRLPRSYAAPHMVRHKNVIRFCGRNSSGKYDLDVQQLRSAFLANETLSERLKSFRLDRINRLASGGAPLALISPHLILLHVFPVESARPDVRLTADDFERLLAAFVPQLIVSNGSRPIYNLDGYLVACEWQSGAYNSYLQIFRNGFLESVDSGLLDCSRGLSASDAPTVRSGWEQRLVPAFESNLQTLARLALGPPYVVSLAFLNVLGYSMYSGSRSYGGLRPFNRDHLLTDEVLIESTSKPPAELLRPLFDQVWNAFGWPRSPSYDENGNLREPR